VLVCGTALLVGVAESAVAQSNVGSVPNGSEPPDPSSLLVLPPESPPVPVAPATVSRTEDGRATLRAVRVVEPIRLDGVLDEALYRDVLPISDFIQMEPQPGAPATERTETWIAFDEDNVYISFRNWDSQMDQVVATDMRRDSNAVWQGNDIVSFSFDTFFDRRNAYGFTVNPLGSKSDGQLVNERQYSQDWNPVWDVKTGRFDGGWTVEAALPFKSIRYGAGTTQVWGFNAMRVKRAKNEVSTVTRVPPARGQGGFRQPSFAATLVGIEAPRAGLNLDVKPYVISSLTTDRTASTPISNDPSGDVGLDVKYAVTEGLAADLTINTDFAQVEADEQQVNLTRFSLFFPEKREFFLENQGTFTFGGVNTGGNNNRNQTAPVLFYSRRIGLNQGRVVPLEVGGRLTGRAGRYTIGVIGTRTGEEVASASPANTFTVVRLKRDILARSSVGLIATGRARAMGGVGSNLAYGLDATFAFYDNLSINTFWAKTETDGLRGNDTSYRAQLDYNGDRYGVQLEQVAIGEHFNPEVGFVRRPDMRRSHAQLRFSPRPSRMPSIRRFRYQVGSTYVENGRRLVESREHEGRFQIEFQNGDEFTATYTDIYELLPSPFPIADGIVLPAGGYDYRNGQVGFELGRQRRVSGQLSLEYGTFYNGRRTGFTVSQGRVSLTNPLSVEPTYSLNKVELEQGDFTTNLFGARVTYTMTPLMFMSALIQYNSAAGSISTNARLRWEYRPGSELFVVYNDERNTLTPGFPTLDNRAFIVKVNRLFRF
jgi:hypothetical protein